MALRLQQLGRHDKAILLLHALASRFPSPENVFALAVSQQALGQLALAAENFRRVLTAAPTLWPAALGLAALTPNPAEVERIYRKALLHSPEEPALLYNLANLLASAAPHPEAETLYRKAIAVRPGFAEAWINLGNQLRLRKELPAAEVAARQAAALAPNSPLPHNLLGAILREMRRGKEAEVCFRRALSVQPGSPEALTNLAHLLRNRGETTEAEACYRHVLTRQPTAADVLNGLGLLCAEDGRLAEGEALLRRSVERQPDNALYRSNLLYAQSYHGLRPPAEILAEARLWETRLPNLSQLPPRVPRHERLRIGYVSPDFRRHPVAYFVARLFTAHDPREVEVFAYSNVVTSDTITESLRRTVSEWHSISALSDDEAATLIRRHEIDILIDLAGHTRHHRLGVFARKPAPIQATWLGYFASTGLSAMDYWITDAVLHPTPNSEAASETIWRLPRCYACYQAPEEAPEPDCATQQGRITFGSFNNLAKLSPATLHLWARVLTAVPDSRLYLKTTKLADPATRTRLLTDFSTLGIASGRLEFEGATPDIRAHFERYARMDIALDSFPFTGATTTADTLWMGVPLITLPGTTQPSRVSASMLTASGHPEWIAPTADDFVARAVALAESVRPLDHVTRVARRQALRAQVANGELGDATGLARALEQAYADMAQITLNSAANKR